jgi:hypothetical protein
MPMIFHYAFRWLFSPHYYYAYADIILLLILSPIFTPMLTRRKPYLAIAEACY